jgi:hypothetical protein
LNHCRKKIITNKKASIIGIRGLFGFGKDTRAGFFKMAGNFSLSIFLPLSALGSAVILCSGFDFLMLSDF